MKHALPLIAVLLFVACDEVEDLATLDEAVEVEAAEAPLFTVEERLAMLTDRVAALEDRVDEAFAGEVYVEAQCISGYADFAALNLGAVDPPPPFAAYMYNDGNGDPALAGWRPYEIATPSLNGWTFACAYRDTHARIVFLE